jgi:hypothetical protein
VEEETEEDQEKEEDGKRADLQWLKAVLVVTERKNNSGLR